MANQLPSLDTTLATLADPTRCASLARLVTEEASVKELSQPFAISAPAITKHLKVLEQAGLIERSRDAQRRPCRLNAAPLAEVAAGVGDYAKFRDESLDRLEDFIAVLQQEGKDHV